jgi:hypothetical protein
MNITAVTLLRNKELVNCCSYSAQVFPSSMESFSRTTQLAYGKNISWVKILVMLLQLLQFSLLEIHPLTPKDTYIVLHGARFKLLTKQCLWQPIMAILVQPCWRFFHAATNLSNYGWVQYSGKECCSFSVLFSPYFSPLQTWVRSSALQTVIWHA